MFSGALLSGVNFAIERDEELHEQLRSLAGKRVALEWSGTGPMQGQSFEWVFAKDGLLEGAGLVRNTPRESLDVILGLTPEFFSSAVDDIIRKGPQGAGQGASSMRGIRIEGDIAVAEQLAPLMALFRERLHPVNLWLQAHPLAALAKKGVDYLINDADLLVKRETFNAHKSELRALRDAIDRLEKNISAYVPTSSR